MKSLVAALFFLIPLLAFSQPGGPPGDRPNRPERMEGRMMDHLKLTDEQRPKFQKLHSDMMKKQIALRADLQTRRVELADLLNADNPDKTNIDAKLTEISKLRGDLTINHADFWFAVNKILTPEQQKVWKDHARAALSGDREGVGMGHGRMHSLADRMRRMFHDWK